MSDALDHFTLAAGLASGGPLSADARVVLLDLAVGFRRAGGSLTWEDWCKLSSDTRSVLEEAYSIVEGERIAVLCRALGVPLPAARRNPTAPENREREGTQLVELAAEELADTVASRVGAN